MTKINCTESLINELYHESKNIKHHVSKQRITRFVNDLFQFLFLIDERTCLSKVSIEARYEELRWAFSEKQLSYDDYDHIYWAQRA